MEKKKSSIAYQNKDVASKMTGEALEGKSLAPLGLPGIKIVKALPTNLPAVESNELRLDHLFLLEDGVVAIMDYESDYSVENFVKYLNYAARVLRRYERKNGLQKLKSLRIIVIYTADVESVREVYDLDGVVVRVEASYLVGQDTEGIYRSLEEKISRGEEISGEDQVHLMILPLTVKGKENKQRMIARTLELVRRMKNRRQKVEVLAGLLTFTDKVIDEEYRESIKEEIGMTQIGKMIFDDGVKAGEKIGISKGISQGIERGAKRKLVELICKKLKKGKSPEEIAEDLEEELDVVREICLVAAPCGPAYEWKKVCKKWEKDCKAKQTVVS